LDKKQESSVWLGDFADDISTAKRKLTRLAKTDKNIKAFLDNQKEQKKRFEKKPKTKSKKEPSEIEFSCEEFVNHFFTKVGKEGYNFELKMIDRRWARNACDEDLYALLDRLNGEEDEDVIVRVLRVFKVAGLPEITPLLWKFIDSKNVSIRDAAIDALAKIQDTRLSELARTKLKSKNFKAKDAEFIQLFIENFTTNDDQLILNALTQTSLSDNVAHSVGFAIREIYKANTELTAPALLQWDYERNPCTECRCITVGLLADLKGMTPDILLECQYDSNEEIRELVTRMKKNQ
jgi:DNA-binding phage protein